jgi:hypothetical protein
MLKPIFATADEKDFCNTIFAVAVAAGHSGADLLLFSQVRFF